ncbi:MAG: hypothetical protein PWP73_1328, partial [Methanococcus sp.]|nr:hypothetical protein [Methanococcus sp.]
MADDFKTAQMNNPHLRNYVEKFKKT